MSRGCKKLWTDILQVILDTFTEEELKKSIELISHVPEYSALKID